jgi:hypothetical protein
VNDRLDNRSFLLVAGERLTASIDSHTAATTTSVTSPTERHQHVRIEEPAERLELGRLREVLAAVPVRALGGPVSLPDTDDNGAYGTPSG